MCNLLFWIGFQIVILAVLERVTRGYRDRTWFKAVFAPAACFEGLCRLLACAISAKAIDGMFWFQDKKPVVQDGKSRIDYVGPVIYLIAWLGFAYLGFRVWAFSVGEAFDVYSIVLPHVDPVEIANGVVAFDCRAFYDGFVAFWQGFDRVSWQGWLFLYVIAGAFPFQAVTFKHVQCGALIIAAAGFLTFSLGYLGIGPGFMSRGWWLRWWILPDTFRIYSLFVTLLTLTLITHIGVRLAWQGLGQMTQKPSSSGGGEKKKAGAKKKKAKAFA
jgi:hypothetical protein